MKRINLFVVLLSLFAIHAQAQGPNNSGTYYRNADGLKGEALKTKLYNIIRNKTHSPTYKELWELYKITDTRADGKVRDWYSNITNFEHITDKAGNYGKEGDVYNREHSVPQSWGSPEADIVHVIPTDGYVNNRRSNYPFGEVGTISYQSANGYSKLGSCKTAGYSGTVFEPNDEVKGDIARIYFYMATCYEGQAENWGGVFGGTKYQPMAQWTYDMMARWSKLDPVDDVERARNNAIYRSDVQGNRNPFVDYPGLEDYIWGSLTDVAFSYDNYQGGGDIVVSERVEQPVFSPDGGTFTDRVDVTITTATEGAAIYYTTNGAEASINSKLYEGPITLTSSTTLKAIAVKEGMSTSYQATATYTITSSGSGEETPTDVIVIALNNSLFGTSFEGSLNGSDLKAYTGTRNGISVVYDKGTGSNMYLNDSQLRLYPGNTLSVSIADGEMTEVEFTIVQNKNNKTIEPSTGVVADGVWTGKTASVVFNVSSGSGHIQLSQLKVKCSTPTGVGAALMFQRSEALAPMRALNSEERIMNSEVYDLEGRLVAKPTRGLYVVGGKKLFVR